MIKTGPTRDGWGRFCRGVFCDKDLVIVPQVMQGRDICNASLTGSGCGAILLGNDFTVLHTCKGFGIGLLVNTCSAYRTRDGHADRPYGWQQWWVFYKDRYDRGVAGYDGSVGLNENAYGRDLVWIASEAVI